MKNFELACLFDLMADILEIKEENPFRIRAYRRAAQNLETLAEDVETLAREERLEEIPGVGKDLAGKILEYLSRRHLDEILRTAKRHRKAVEINSYPTRLDLNDVHARRARDLGVLIAVDTDAHVLDHLAAIELGVAMARRAWIEKACVVNTWPAKQLLAWVRSSRPEAGRRSAAASGRGAKL